MNILVEVVMNQGALTVCQGTLFDALVLNAASRLNEVITVMWHVSYVAFIVFSSAVAGYPSPFLLPLLRWMPPDRRPPPALRSVELCRVDGSAWFSCHAGQSPPSEPAWSLLCYQPPRQTGELCLHISHFRLLFLRTFCTFTWMHLWVNISGCAFISLGVFAPKKRQPLPLSPQNYPLHGSEVNGTHPAGFHSGSNSYGVPGHTPPISSSDTIMGKPFEACTFLHEKSALCFLTISSQSTIVTGLDENTFFPPV